MTKKQLLNYNKMLRALKIIAKDYQTAQQLKRSADKLYGLGYEETLEMAYENIQETAKQACKGVSPIVLKVINEPA